MPEPRVKQNCRDGRYRLCKIRRAGYGVCFQEQPCIADDQCASEAHGHDLADLPLHQEPGIDVPRNGQREQRRSEAPAHATNRLRATTSSMEEPQ